MTTYYIEQEGQIKLHDTDRGRLVTTLKFTPQYKGLEIKETDRLNILLKSTAKI